MHVEVLNQSGLAAIRYTNALGISANRRHRWRELFDAEEVANSLAVAASSACPATVMQWLKQCRC